MHKWSLSSLGVLIRFSLPVFGRLHVLLKWLYLLGCYSGTKILHGRFFKGKTGRVRADMPCATMQRNLICICFSNVPRPFISGMICLYIFVFLTLSLLLYRMVLCGGVGNPHLGDRCSSLPVGSFGTRGMHKFSKVLRNPFMLFFSVFWHAMIPFIRMTLYQICLLYDAGGLCSKQDGISFQIFSISLFVSLFQGWAVCSYFWWGCFFKWLYDL